MLTADTLYWQSGSVNNDVWVQGFRITQGLVGTGGAVTTTVTSASTALASNFTGLKVEQATAATLTVTADALVLADSGGNTTTINTVSETADITVSGAGGLDTGSEASSTWYYVYIIRNSGSSAVDALLSVSASAPTLPSGFDESALVSAVFNDSSSDFRDFMQTGRNYENKHPWPTIASGNSGSLTVWSAVDTTDHVPSGLSENWQGQLARLDNGTYITNDSTVTVNIGTTQDLATGYGAFGPSNPDPIMNVEFNIMTANTIYYISNAASFVRTRGFDITKI
jgi:hypothetical protein